MLKKFFFAAAGVFLLAFAFHLGSTTARAQAGARAISLSFTSQGPLVVDDSGRIFNVFLNAHVATIPGAVAASGYQGSGDMWVVCGNGDLYNTYVNSGQRTYNFSYVGNIFSSAPTTGTHQSWSQVKERFR